MVLSAEQHAARVARRRAAHAAQHPDVHEPSARVDGTRARKSPSLRATTRPGRLVVAVQDMLFQPRRAEPARVDVMRKTSPFVFQRFETLHFRGQRRAKTLNFAVRRDQFLGFRQQLPLPLDEHGFAVFFEVAVEPRRRKGLHDHVARPRPTATHAVRILHGRHDVGPITFLARRKFAVRTRHRRAPGDGERGATHGTRHDALSLLDNAHVWGL